MNYARIMIGFAAFLIAASGCAADATRVTDGPEIRSASELQEYLSSGVESPLDRLSEPARQRFLGSLVFGEKGVASYKYTDLDAELTPLETRNILGLFGLKPVKKASDGPVLYDNGAGGDESTLPETTNPDYPDYSCSGRGTCSRSIGDICTTNC